MKFCLIPKQTAITIVGLVFVFQAGISTGARVEGESEVKTAYIFNFSKYTTWPKTPAASIIDICLLGTDPLAEHLGALEHKTAQTKEISVQLRAMLPSASTCEILFISDSEKDNLPSILSSLADKAILTVSDIQGFAEQGGMIELIRKDHKIHFIINIEQVSKAKLIISSRLLKLATITHGAQCK